MPTLRVERELLRAGAARVAGMDEVGRGALGGPVSVGVVVVDHTVRRGLPGVRDSKLLTPAAREDLVPRIQRWAVTCAVGHASAAEVDALGIIAALRRAGWRAMAELALVPDVVLLDGSHDWLTPPAQAALFEGDGAETEPGGAEGHEWPGGDAPRVVTRVKADLSCTSVAAASVLAKTQRDARMVALAVDFPDFGWADNKGYASPEHLAALAAHGPSVEHRRSWRLPGLEPER